MRRNTGGGHGMTPRLTSAIVATVGALSLAGVATAHDDHGTKAKGAKVYRATLVKTAASDTAQLPNVAAKAQLVDGKKRNKISIHVRGLKPGDTYLWHIHKAKNATDDPCAPGSPAADPAPYGDWTYGPLVANEDGNASAKGKSATFDSRADKGPFYVNVHLADGTVIACGVLKFKPKKSHGKHKHASEDPVIVRSEKGEANGRGPKSGHGPDA
jgi:hypothetical protein